MMIGQSPLCILSQHIAFLLHIIHFIYLFCCLFDAEPVCDFILPVVFVCQSHSFSLVFRGSKSLSDCLVPLRHQCHCSGRPCSGIMGDPSLSNTLTSLHRSRLHILKVADYNVHWRSCLGGCLLIICKAAWRYLQWLSPGLVRKQAALS